MNPPTANSAASFFPDDLGIRLARWTSSMKGALAKSSWKCHLSVTIDVLFRPDRRPLNDQFGIDQGLGTL
jgi:hypothetical protein